MFRTRSVPVAFLIALGGTLLSAGASAQQVYRIVGPDGRVSFSDKAPVEKGVPRAAAAGVPGQPGTVPAGISLPFDLRQVVAKFPVTLYTGADCGPCGAGKAYLTSRGVPFTEKTVNTSEDVNALQRLATDNSLPLLTVGGQQIKGYSDSEWGQFLDAAGYPKSSQLPAAYRNAPAVPLVALQRSIVPNADQTGQSAADGRPPVGNRPSASGQANSPPAPIPVPATSPDNPAGIRF